MNYDGFDELHNRLLKERDNSRNNGDKLAECLHLYLLGKNTEEDLRRALNDYSREEKYFLLPPAKPR